MDVLYKCQTRKYNHEGAQPEGLKQTSCRFIRLLFKLLMFLLCE